MPITLFTSRWPEPSYSASAEFPIAKSRTRGTSWSSSISIVSSSGPAHYDDLLTVRTTVERVTHVKIVHHYEVFRDGLLLAEGHSTLACVDRDGKPQALPEMLR